MADDEEAVQCSRVNRYHVLLLFIIQLTNEFNSFIETNYVVHNFIHITNKVVHRACLARRDGRVSLTLLFALVVTCCVVL